MSAIEGKFDMGMFILVLKIGFEIPEGTGIGPMSEIENIFDVGVVKIG